MQASTCIRKTLYMFLFRYFIEVGFMKKILISLLILSIALIGTSFVAASHDVDNINVDESVNVVSIHDRPVLGTHSIISEDRPVLDTHSIISGIRPMTGPSPIISEDRPVLDTPSIISEDCPVLGTPSIISEDGPIIH